ncbi:hypothetical protein KBD71_02435 [Candidatus Woesebacteria bacterium]|nr:hypothetical protein [Candidatus Woesebacteria bacterium]
MKQVKSVYVPIWEDKARLKDPRFWHMKAWHFSSTTHFIIAEFEKIKDGTPIQEYGHLFNAINTTPYITGVATELFLKGYLVQKGVSIDKLRNDIGHNLQKLRELCCKFKDTRFLNSDLIFLTDTLGEQLTKDGGIRYPNVNPMAIYFEVFENSLNILQQIAGEVDVELLGEEDK